MTGLVHYWPLSEPEGVTQANDRVVSDDAAPLTIAGTGAAVTFGTEGVPTGPHTAVEFTIDGFGAGQYLKGPSVNLSEWTAGVFLLRATGVSNNPFAIGTETDTFFYINAADDFVFADDGASLFLTHTLPGGQTFEDPHHLAVTYDGATARLYVDGVQVDTSSGIPLSGRVKINDPIDLGEFAVLHVSVHDRALSADEVSDIANAGLTGFSGEPAGERLERYARWAGIPAAEQSIDADAVTPMAHIDSEGQSPVELMQKVASTDGGVLHDSRSGVLTYTGRGVRYNATAALTLDVSASEVEVGYSPKLDRSALINKVTATVSDGTYSVTAENTSSTAEYGVHSNADLELATTDSDEAHAAAWWRVNTYGEPGVRVPQLGVELAKLSATRQAAVLAVKVGDKIRVTGLPSQSDESSKSFFCEGYTETITDSQHRIEFNVSPTAGFDVWEIGHATYGQYDAFPIAY